MVTRAGVFRRMYLVYDSLPSAQDPASQVLLELSLDEAWKDSFPWARRYRSPKGNERTHWRMGTRGSTRSTRCAAVSAICRPPHEGQKPRLLHEKAKTWSSPQSSQRTLTKPWRPTFEASHRDFAAFVCREWNASHTGPRRLVELRSIGFWQQIVATGVVDLRPSVLYEYDCDGSGTLLWSEATRHRGARAAPH